MTETMVMMSFLTLIIFGFVHLSMMAATKSMVSYAAFAAARTVMVRGSVQRGWPAAWQVLDNIRWWSNDARNMPDPIGVTTLNGRQGLTVTYRVPFGLPIFNNVPTGGLRITAFSPYIIQDGIPEEGDNAQR